jgi:hypothetical protein
MTDDEAKRSAYEIDTAVSRYQGAWAALQPLLRVVEVARYLLGTGLVVEPTGRNDGVPRFLFCDGEWDDVHDRGLAWCAAFVVYCHSRALHSIPGNRFLLRAVPRLAAKARELGVFTYAVPDIIVDPEPGWTMFCWGRRGSDADTSLIDVHHCGIVESVDGEQVHTIEGNWGNKLSRATRHLNDKVIAGYAKF